jgi:hypothetical protein
MGGALCGTRYPLKHVIADGKPRECAVFLRHRDGYSLPARVRPSPIHDQGGNIIGAVELFDETTTPARHAIWQLHNFGCLDDVTPAVNRRYGNESAARTRGPQ